MKAVPHSYALHLSKTDKAVLTEGIKCMIKSGKLSPDSPETMARALKILGSFNNIAPIITGWDAKYVLIPALNAVHPGMIEPGMYECLSMMAEHK